VSDIVKRLTLWSKSLGFDAARDCEEAAAEIAKLRAEVEQSKLEAAQWKEVFDRTLDDVAAHLATIERLTAALKMHACDCTFAVQCAVPSKCRNYLARAALTTAEEKSND
jgi:hypothetical protein